MERYPILALVRILLSISGWLSLAVGLILVVDGLSGMFSPQSGMYRNEALIAQALFKLLSGFGLALSGLVVVAIAELLTVFVRIEINTRHSASSGEAASPKITSTYAIASSSAGVSSKGPLTWSRIKRGDVTRGEVALGALTLAGIIYLLFISTIRSFGP